MGGFNKTNKIDDNPHGVTVAESIFWKAICKKFEDHDTKYIDPPQHGLNKRVFPRKVCGRGLIKTGKTGYQVDFFDTSKYLQGLVELKNEMKHIDETEKDSEQAIRDFEKTKCHERLKRERIVKKEREGLMWENLQHTIKQDQECLGILDEARGRHKKQEPLKVILARRQKFEELLAEQKAKREAEKAREAALAAELGELPEEEEVNHDVPSRVGKNKAASAVASNLSKASSLASRLSNMSAASLEQTARKALRKILAEYAEKERVAKQKLQAVEESELRADRSLNQGIYNSFKPKRIGE